MRQLVLLLLAWASLAAIDPPDPSKLIETFVVNLDLPPEERWVPLALQKADIIRAVVDLLTPVLLPHPTSLALVQAVNNTLPNEYIREMQGIATALNLKLEHIIATNIFYEITGVVNLSFPLLSRSCTSLVAQRSNGTVYIARNQDYPPPFSLLMVHAIFQRANKTVYQGTTYAGTIGLSTAAVFAPGGKGWALSIDARHNPLHATPRGEALAVAAAKRGAAVFPMITRQACEQTSDFAGALNYLSKQELILPGYLILAGSEPGQGAVITRNSTGNDTNVLALFDPKGKDAGGGGWYVAQTNYDHWEPEPNYPGTNVTRRGTATKVLDSIGADAIDLLGLWDVLDTPPVYNFATIHTDLISVAWGEYKTYKRHGPL